MREPLSALALVNADEEEARFDPCEDEGERVVFPVVGLAVNERRTKPPIRRRPQTVDHPIRPRGYLLAGGSAFTRSDGDSGEFTPPIVDPEYRNRV
jgi:hypothetical protein